jgi:hypothetical protein
VLHVTPGESAHHGNADFPWDKFDPVDYLQHNYATVRDDDRKILTFVRDFFVRVSSTLPGGAALHGIDVGTGPNLYPALAMLPLCGEVTLYEYSRSNVSWLESQHAAQWPSWRDTWSGFWRVLCEQDIYRHADRPDMGRELSRRTKIVQGSVFDLDPAQNRYDVGTMFFGPESLSQRDEEFHSAIDHLLGVLHPDAPFAIALMEHSDGYFVAKNEFPATYIDLADVIEYLHGQASDLSSERVGADDDPLRDGYTGMLVVCGRAV